MTQFLRDTIDDMQRGRETWRVRLTILIPTLIISVGVALAEMRF